MTDARELAERDAQFAADRFDPSLNIHPHGGIRIEVFWCGVGRGPGHRRAQHPCGQRGHRGPASASCGIIGPGTSLAERWKSRNSVIRSTKQKGSVWRS